MLDRWQLQGRECFAVQKCSSQMKIRTRAVDSSSQALMLNLRDPLNHNMSCRRPTRPSSRPKLMY